MKLSHITLSLSAPVAMFSSPLHAGPFDGYESVAKVYVSIPFDGVSRTQSSSILGFSFDWKRRETADGFSYKTKQAAASSRYAPLSLLDLRFDVQQRAIVKLSINGINALTYKLRACADGTTAEVPDGIAFPVAAAGVTAAAVAYHVAFTEKDSPPQTGGFGATGAVEAVDAGGGGG